MARGITTKPMRGTRSAFTALKASSGLVAHELLYLTDEKRLVVATSTNAADELPAAADLPAALTYINTSGGTLVANSRNIVDASSGNITLTLPTSCSVGDTVILQRVYDEGANVLTINYGASGDFANTADTSVTIDAGFGCTFRWKSSNLWEII